MSKPNEGDANKKPGANAPGSVKPKPRKKGKPKGKTGK